MGYWNRKSTGNLNEGWTLVNNNVSIWFINKNKCTILMTLITNDVNNY